MAGAAGEAQTLRIVTCGSVDDGKSTLIGRLLHESRSIADDQRAALERDSRRFGTQGERVDYALLLDGLEAEREQRITIDVAYRYVAHSDRRIMIADAPGHEQYTRNMATAASTADLAILLADARKGLLVQTRRHARIASMMGVRHVVLAVNKMDLVGFDEAAFRSVEAAFGEMASSLGFDSVASIPLCALEGDNVGSRSARMPWHRGPCLRELLEQTPCDAAPGRSFRLAVQWINRPDAGYRGIAGTVAHGSVAVGDAIRIVPGGRISRIKHILSGFDSVARAGAKQAVSLELDDNVDVGRGDVLAAPDDAPEAADQFAARLLWLDDNPLIPGRPYILRIHTREVPATITEIKFREDASTGAELAAKILALNEFGVVNISTSQAVAFEPYARSHQLGAFILIDRLTGATAGAGMLLFALRRAGNIQWQALDVTRRARAELMAQRPRCIWFTGLPSSGKSTIANLLEKRLHAEGRKTYLLDGDNVRHGLNRDLGFTEADRVENIRRVAEVARLMVDAGLIVLVAFISPFRAERALARGLFDEGDFIEVFVDAPIEVCERRDPKGLYAKARAGMLKNFTGIDSAYEAPQHPEVHLSTGQVAPEQSVDRIIERLG